MASPQPQGTGSLGAGVGSCHQSHPCMNSISTGASSLRGALGLVPDGCSGSVPPLHEFQEHGAPVPSPRGGLWVWSPMGAVTPPGRLPPRTPGHGPCAAAGARASPSVPGLYRPRQGCPEQRSAAAGLQSAAS